MGTRVNYSGLVVAGVGFFSTRFTVTLALYEQPLRFYLAGVVPLVLGLGLAAFGVALTVADVDPRLVRTTALWCVFGTSTMVVLIALTLVGSSPSGLGVDAMRSQAYLSNFLVGGSIGGTLTGLYASRNTRQQTELSRRADRLRVLNRFLRHEVLNSVTAIRGYAALRDSDERDAAAVVEDHSESIERTIEEVKYLTRTAQSDDVGGRSVDAAACLRTAVETVREAYPGVDIVVTVDAETTTVRATDRLERVFVHLLENAVVHTGTERVTVLVTEAGPRLEIGITDDGPGLPERQRQLLETGTIADTDDPGTGFGVNIVRFLVESFQGSITTSVDEGTTVTVSLPLSDPGESVLRPSDTSLSGFRPSLPHLVVALVAALVAGVPYGIVSEALGGSISGIGVFYGAPSPVVGWITHEFHSVVFGFAFAGLVSVIPVRYRDRAWTYLAVGIGWGLTLWIVAAGIVAPLWLRLLSVPASLPNITVRLFATHLVWGLTLGLSVLVGYRYAVPWLESHGL